MLWLLAAKREGHLADEVSLRPRRIGGVSVAEELHVIEVAVREEHSEADGVLAVHRVGTELHQLSGQGGRPVYVQSDRGTPAGATGTGHLSGVNLREQGRSKKLVLRCASTDHRP